MIVPLTARTHNAEAIWSYANKIAQTLKTQTYDDEPVRVHVDDKDRRPGEKMWGWTKKGVPLILEVGERELENQNVVVRNRVTGDKDTLSACEATTNMSTLLDNMQKAIFNRAHAFRQSKTTRIETRDDFYAFYGAHQSEGFVLAYCADDEVTEKALKEDLKVTARCVPLETQSHKGSCIFTGRSNAPLTLFARAY